MGKIEATAGMLRAARKMRKQDAILKFVMKAQAGKLKVARAPDVGAGRPKAVETAIGALTPERAAQSEPEAIQKVQAPPFNMRVMPLLQRYAERLGPEALLTLEKLYEVGRKGAGSRGLTAGYDGIKVDASRSSFEHLTAAESDAHDLFHRAMHRMPRELRAIVLEVLFEEGGPQIKDSQGYRARKPLEVIRDTFDLNNEQYQRAGLVTLLKIVAWCVQVEFLKGGRHGKGRKRQQQ